METAPRLESAPFGGIAQLVERVARNNEAWGSNPHTSTNFASVNSGDFPASKRIQKIRDVASDLARGSSKEFAVAAAKHSEARAPFLFESDQNPPGGRVHKFARHLNFHRAGPEAAPIPRGLRARISLGQSHQNNQSLSLASYRIRPARFSTEIFLEPFEECGLERIESRAHGSISVLFRVRQGHLGDVKSLDGDVVVSVEVKRLKDCHLIDVAVPIAVRSRRRRPLRSRSAVGKQNEGENPTRE